MLERPLSTFIEKGLLNLTKKTDKQIKSLSAKGIKRLIQVERPDVIVFCRYGGERSKEILKEALVKHIPTLMIIDDDLLEIPKEIGKAKYDFHNNPLRLNRIRYLLENVDLIYSSTKELTKALKHKRIENKYFTANLYCSGPLINTATSLPKEKLTIGYMGFGRPYDLDIALPAIIQILEAYPNVHFELFGTIPRPKELDRFDERFHMHEPVRSSYDDFLVKLSDLGWDIGICPLAPLPFNMVKAHTKWVEYTQVGIAVVASDAPPYQLECSEGRGKLVETPEEWRLAIEQLLNNPEKRLEQVEKAQEYLVENCNSEIYRKQLLNVFKSVGVHIQEIEKKKMEL